MDGKCIIATCSKPGPVQTVKVQAVKKIFECAIERHDDEMCIKIQSVLTSQGEQAAVDIHKTCYCNFTSKDHIRKHLAKKRKEGESDEVPAARVRRSQVIDFNFKNQCLFCAEICKPKDPKHPDRWDRVIQCERIGIKDTTPFKDIVLQYCADRADTWSREVALRCHGVHDLSAAEAQYHHRCYDDFRKMPAHKEQTPEMDDKALQQLVDQMYMDRKTCTWTSIELHDKYVINGGNLTRKQMFTKLTNYLCDDIVVLSIQGCASIVGFREYVGKIVKISEVDSADEDNEDALVRKVINEARAIPFNNKNYDLSDFNFTKTKEKTSSTLLKFVSKLVSNGEVNKASLSLSQSIQSHITTIGNQTTLGLGIKLHHKFGSSELIRILHEHGYIVSYDEVLRFRKSAAKSVHDNATTFHKLMGLSRTVGLIFGWYDNFDLLVSTPNGRRETHAMATEFQVHPAGIIETGSVQSRFGSLTFPRLTIKQTKQATFETTVPLIHYTGPKKVIPPAVPTIKAIGKRYSDLHNQQISLLAAQEKDTQWLNSLSQEEDAMEWSGFNNLCARNEGNLKRACTYMFGPLIDAPPSHPDTILTTLTYMQQSLVDMGMEKVHLCMDMQLYAVTKQVCWYRPMQFGNVIVHPGGMHIIQSFLSCIGKLMNGSGLESYVAAAYGGLTGIFNGKSWVKAMRAFRGVAAALLKSFLSTGTKSFAEIEEYLESVRVHPTGRHWVDNFLFPTLLVHQFERAEREGDIHLRVLAMKRMLKYFFLAGHAQYARYLTQYLLEMHVCPVEDTVDLACRHHDGYWNAVSADQFGEQTGVKIGKGALKGMTLSPDLVSEWIDAFPITVYISDRLKSIYSECDPDHNSEQKHKEESKSRRSMDAHDRNLIAAAVNKYTHPLDDNRPYLYNPVTGQIASNDVNVADSLVMGEKMEYKYISSLPDGFYNAISSPIKTMSVSRRRSQDAKTKPVIDLGNIFLRLLLIGQQRQIELAPLFAYELCSVPSSLVDGNCCLRKGIKSALVKRLGVVELSPKLPDTVIVDVSQLFYHIVWPHGGNPSDLIASIQNRLYQYPDNSKKIVVFDKYHQISAKDHERLRRSGESVIDYEFSLTCNLPKREAIMKSKNNKRMLASVLSTFDLGENCTMETADDGGFGHDEADITMISYVMQAAEADQGIIRVLSDDTDVFVLLVYWVYKAQLQCEVQMERWDGTVLNINGTCDDLGSRCLELLGMHALSGCDTTSYPFGKGKLSALNTLLNGDFPGLSDVLGEVNKTHEQLINAAEPFFVALYGQPAGTTMMSARYRLFIKNKKSPKVMSLPPTSQNLLQHILRAHLQVMLWKSADSQSPPEESKVITDFGWEFKNELPIPVIAKGDPAPPELLDVIRCQCKATNNKCITEGCGCHKEHLSCTSFCNCSGGCECFNPYTNQTSSLLSEEDQESDTEDTQEEQYSVLSDYILSETEEEWDD